MTGIFGEKKPRNQVKRFEEPNPYSHPAIENGRVKAGKRAKLFRLQGLLVDRWLTLGRSFECKDLTNRLS
jgi:hypothetical protein